MLLNKIKAIKALVFSKQYFLVTECTMNSTYIKDDNNDIVKRFAIIGQKIKDEQNIILEAENIKNN